MASLEGSDTSVREVPTTSESSCLERCRRYYTKQRIKTLPIYLQRYKGRLTINRELKSRHRCAWCLGLQVVESMIQCLDSPIINLENRILTTIGGPSLASMHQTVPDGVGGVGDANTDERRPAAEIARVNFMMWGVQMLSVLKLILSGNELFIVLHSATGS